METLGITWTQADLATFAEQALAYALPRIALTSGLFVLAFLLHRAAGWVLSRVMDRVIKRTRMNLELRVWIDDARSRRGISDEITDRVKLAFDEADLEIPYPKRDLYVRALPSGEAEDEALIPAPLTPDSPDKTAKA